MSKPVIKVEGLSKKYRLGTVGYGSLKQDLASLWARARGKEDPNAKIGQKSRLDLKGDFWALKDVGFEVQQGDRVGIIGRNGAGKSTLLKLLSRVTGPTSGDIWIKGRIASLLEVGTGFHPELTGRDNVFLNGAILGMKRREIQRKFDEIVAFAGVDQFIDTPVKRYSSGMYVRLAFSVAAHLDSEIMVVDEVLAVGDMDFQRKCLGKMETLSVSEGKTILFVSHGLALLESLCNKGILLREGMMVPTLSDDIHQVIKQYQAMGRETATNALGKVESIRLNHFEINDAEAITFSSGFSFEAHVEVLRPETIIDFVIDIYDEEDRLLVRHGVDLTASSSTAPGVYAIKGAFPGNTLNVGVYRIGVILGQDHTRGMLVDGHVGSLSIQVDKTYSPWNNKHREGIICVPVDWRVSKVQTRIAPNQP